MSYIKYVKITRQAEVRSNNYHLKMEIENGMEEIRKKRKTKVKDKLKSYKLKMNKNKDKHQGDSSKSE